MKNGKVTVTDVTPGHDFGDQIEIVAGLKADDQVVLNPPDSLVSGQEVTIVQAATAGRSAMTRSPMNRLIQLTSRMRQVLYPVLILAGALSIHGLCRRTKVQDSPQFRFRPHTRRLANWKTAQPNDQHLGGNWWEIFQDPQLNCFGAADQCFEPELEGRGGAISAI